MKAIRILLSAGVLPCALLLNSCASNDSLSKANYQSGYSWAGLRSSPAPGAQDSVARNVAERPGLGTTLGGEIGDSSTDAHFYRRSHNSPDKLASFYYNDEEGAKAMAGMSGKSSKHSGRFDLADGILRASLCAGWDDDRQPWYESGGKVFVIGGAGQRYSIELENTSKQRVEVVVSVDGLDVLDGASAAFSKRGYVIPPRSTIHIRGMKSGGKLRSFEFGSVRDSQAAKTGGEKAARNVGVIGIALFIEDEEAAKRDRIEEGMKRGDARAFPGS
ncbi:MAG: hypothetical protein K8R87_12625 [Verrucomicrobia bacterium]|nr:hypothetical protein [Verrucomicrobiota bacterium]